MALSPTSARRHFGQQAAIAAAAVTAVRRLFKRNRPLSEVVATVAAYQLASATTGSQAIAEASGAQAAVTNASLFAGVSSAGFPISEPIVATIDKFVPAPLEALPDNWWADALDFMASVEQLIESEVQDAGRSASSVEIAARPEWQNYVRLLVPPSCARCTILAGRVYRDLEAFQRHPKCDCQMWPVQSWQEAHDAGLVSSPQQAFEKGQVRGLSKADAQAIADGADMATVVNATGGTSAPGITNAVTTDLFGHRVKATTYGTTKRAAWRKANPTRLVRLRPESIYRIADGDRAEALRLLRLYGYIK